VRVRGARVRLLGKSGRTNRHGVTVFNAPRRRLDVSVSARGYTSVRQRLNFARRRQTIRIYRPDLQWPVYGATTARTQAPTQIQLRPPFRLVWSRGMGNLIEFPAVVWNGFAYIGNQRATVQAISMRSGKLAWRHDTPGAPRMASSPAVDGDEIVYHTMGGQVYVLDRANGHLKWSWNAGSAIEPSPVVVNGIDYFGAANGEMYALDLHRHRLRWKRLPRRQDHLERGHRGWEALRRRLRRAALGALAGDGRDALGRPGEREDLRDARRGTRPGLRPLVDGQLADGVLDLRPLPLARHRRLLRVLLSCGRGRRCLLRLL